MAVLSPVTWPPRTLASWTPYVPTPPEAPAAPLMESRTHPGQATLTHHGHESEFGLTLLLGGLEQSAAG